MRSGWIILVAVFCLLIAVIVFLIVREKKKDDVYVIGENLAKAAALEEQRKLKGDAGKSPMPDNGYDFWRGETSLINPVKLSLDSTLGELCQKFMSGDERMRAYTRRSISMDEFYTLLTFSERAAVFAIRERQADWVVKGLTAISMIEAERTDFRDILVALSLLYHSANRVGANADHMLRDAAAMSEPELAKLVEGFINRNPEDKDIRSSWGYDEVETKDGVGFIGWSIEDYNPTLDLKKVALEISDLIATDKYQPDSVDVATDLPATWLETKENSSVEKTLEAVRGGATVSARLRPNEHPTHESQTLDVFIVEVQDERIAQTLLSMSRKKKPSTYSMVGLAEGKLFCLIVARSYVEGVKSFETTEGLKRFSKGITEILARYARGA